MGAIDRDGRVEAGFPALPGMEMSARKRAGEFLGAAAALPAFFALAMIALLIGAQAAYGQSETVLYNFTGGSDGGYATSRLTADGAGNFYGTTFGGGLGYGTVFELSPNGSGGWNETVLYNFTGGLDGGGPLYSYLIFDASGNLYGTAYAGGAHGQGVVFELSPDGVSWSETVLYSFNSIPPNWTDGSYPESGLIMDTAGNLYGTTQTGGGMFQPGVVFELSPAKGGWTEQVIFAYPAQDGSAGAGGLTMDAAGNLYGVGNQVVFELSPGQGGWTANVLHTFGEPKGGLTAQGIPVLDKNGNIYGTTLSGGAKGNGTVYKLILGKKGVWTEKVLYSFKGRKDGSNPLAGIIFDAAGNIYGTTTAGCKTNNGTVYELVAPIGKGSYKEKVLWSFSGPDGSAPDASLIFDGAGNLYGTTKMGGTAGMGSVFEVVP